MNYPFEKIPHKTSVTVIISILILLVIMFVPFSGKNSHTTKPENDTNTEVPPSVPTSATQLPSEFTDSEKMPKTAKNKYTELMINAGVMRSGAKNTACAISGNTALSAIEAHSGSICIPNTQDGVTLNFVSSNFTVPQGASKIFLSDNITTIFSQNGNPIDTLGAFYGNKELTHFIPSENLTYIGDKAFYGCTSLEHIFLPYALKHIGSRAFYGCTRLDSVYIFGETSIGEAAFALCRNLKDVYLSENVCRVGTGAFEHTKFYENLTDEFCVISGILLKYNGKSEDVIIPEGVRIIADSTFAGRLSVKSVTFPETVEYIGNSTFRSCENLVSVNFGNTKPAVGEFAFDGCPVNDTEAVSELKTETREMFISEETVNGKR